ncbi:hypothetical protein PM082_005713 [Marasmius tenuissimus]|nr:hypothetical protein PM082_005713 [Marasmius tenuissimus]
MVPPRSMSAHSMTPTFLDVPGTPIAREGRPLERGIPHHHSSRSSSSHRGLHSGHNYGSRESHRSHSVDHQQGHGRGHEHSLERRDRGVTFSRERRNSATNTSANHPRAVLTKRRPSSQVIVVPHGAKIIPPNIQPNQVVPIIKHVMKGVCKPYLHHHSASQGLEAFFPRNDHPAYNPTPYPSPRFTFEYSRCTGRKRALCIGINYYGSDRPLKGCINDAIHIRDYLIKHRGFRREDIMTLRDDSPNPRKRPTRKNMLAAMRWLVEGAQKDDSLFFHYSGHGGQTEDLDGDEIDGFDEVIFPSDYKQKGHILDDDLHTIMVKPLPPGCRLTALFDSCHSGTVLDLPYVYTPSGRKKGIHVSSRALQRKASRADVISWSGCKDDQKSTDTFQGGQPVGAMSYAFINTLKKNPDQSYNFLLKSLKGLLFERFNQTPQIGSSHHIDTSLKFVI